LFSLFSFSFVLYLLSFQRNRFNETFPKITVGMILRKTFISLKQFRQNISQTIILQKLWFEIYLKSWLSLPVFHSLNRLFLAFLYLVPSSENSRLKNFDFNVYLFHRHSTVFSKNTFLLLKEKLFKSRYDKEKNSIKGLDCTLVQFQIIFIKLKKAQK